MSDIAAALFALYQRNPDALERMAASVASDVKVRQAVRKNHTNGGMENATR